MHSFLDGLGAEHREPLLALSREVSFPAGARIFEERRPADRFWLLRLGGVDLDLRVRGRQPTVLQTLGSGDLLGWSWLFPPYLWTLTAQARVAVSALEFDAAEVRALCETDPALGHQFVLRCAEVIAERLRTTRTRLLDLFAPYGSAGDLG